MLWFVPSLRQAGHRHVHNRCCCMALHCASSGEACNDRKLGHWHELHYLSRTARAKACAVLLLQAVVNEDSTADALVLQKENHRLRQELDMFRQLQQVMLRPLNCCRFACKQSLCKRMRIVLALPPSVITQLHVHIRRSEYVQGLCKCT